MGLFRKLKKAIKKVVKVAKVTAPIWTSFVPGGSIAGKLIAGVGGGGGGGGSKLSGVLGRVVSVGQKIQQRGRALQQLTRDVKHTTPLGQMTKYAHEPTPDLAASPRYAQIMQRTLLQQNGSGKTVRHGGNVGPHSVGWGKNRIVADAEGGWKGEARVRQRARRPAARTATRRKPARRRRMTSAQILYFGTKRQRAALRRRAA